MDSSDYIEDYKKLRSCKFISGDATKVDYKKVFDDLGFPKRIDFLSVDIDDASGEALKAVPLLDYRFNIVIAEHDLYKIGPKLQEEEREILNKAGYHLLFGNVRVPLSAGALPCQEFEDWWCDLSAFNVDKLSSLVVKLGNDILYADHIVDVLKTMPDVIKDALLK